MTGQTFDDIFWHEIIGRVSRGTATGKDAGIVNSHLGLRRHADRIARTGGDASQATVIATNLRWIRRRTLAKYGFREVRRA